MHGIPVRVFNPQSKPVRIYKDRTIGKLCPLLETDQEGKSEDTIPRPCCHICRGERQRKTTTNGNSEANGNETTSQNNKERMKEMADLFKIDNPSFSIEQKEMVYNILRHNDAISRGKSDLGELKTSQHFIDTGEVRPIRVPRCADYLTTREGARSCAFSSTKGLYRVIAYAAKALSKPQRNYSTTRKELLALIWAMEHFEPYLLGREFMARTDHNALTLNILYAHFFESRVDYGMQSSNNFLSSSALFAGRKTLFDRLIFQIKPQTALPWQRVMKCLCLCILLHTSTRKSYFRILNNTYPIYVNSRLTAFVLQ